MPPLPETAPSRKLVAVQVRIIRRVLATGGVTMEDLAVLFGVSRQAIEQIANYETWREDRFIPKP